MGTSRKIDQGFNKALLKSSRGQLGVNSLPSCANVEFEIYSERKQTTGKKEPLRLYKLIPTGTTAFGSKKYSLVSKSRADQQHKDETCREKSDQCLDQSSEEHGLEGSIFFTRLRILG